MTKCQLQLHRASAPGRIRCHRLGADREPATTRCGATIRREIRALERELRSAKPSMSLKFRSWISFAPGATGLLDQVKNEQKVRPFKYRALYNPTFKIDLAFVN